ncbi:single-stranded-DNA-specific exonuclease RecJ [Maricaulis sp. CAU 1757]
MEPATALPESQTVTEDFLGVAESLTGRCWRLRPAPEAEVILTARQQKLPDALARVLCARDVKPDDAAQFLAPRLRDVFPDPSDFQDMDKAAGLIWDAVEAGRPIAVFADYDVDGATSAAQLTRWLRHVGQDPIIYIPDRIEEGYGPSARAFEALRDGGAELVVTLDCGAAAHEALRHGAGLGLEIVVIDHHLMDAEFPPAAALVNPNRPDDTSGCGHLAAAGVTFVLLAALNREGRRRGRLSEASEPKLIDWLDLAALGTICDVVPLTGLNRAMVAQGLKVMGRWQQPGLRALAEVAGVDGAATAYHAGFLLGPRINAGGRVGRADLGARLLTTDEDDEALRLARELDALNRERRGIESEVLDAAMAQVERQGAERSVLVAAGDGWHPGVIGVVAGRLKEKHCKPSLVIGIDRKSNPPIGKGSGRSVPGVNLGGAIAAAREQGLLLAGGGHAMAGGLSVDPDRITELVAWLDDRLAPELAAASEARALHVDGLLTASGLTPELAELLERAAPFGQGNPEPRFAFSGLRVSFAKRVGSDHVRFTLSDVAGTPVSGIAFRCADTPMGEALLSAGDALWHAVGRVKLDTWQGRRRVQLQLEDLATAADC